MKIAAAYDNEEVFQHFGKCEAFKIYEVNDGLIEDYEIVKTEGTGHQAMVDFLVKNNVNVVICGGAGEEAAEALSEAGILLESGISGSCDDAVLNFLETGSASQGANCGCGGGCSDGGCGGGCSGCGGGCGGGCAPAIEGKNAGKKVRVHYRGTLNDGTQFDSSYDRGETLDFICGSGMMIRGFDMAVVNMNVGDKITVHLQPSEAYGESNPNAIFEVPLNAMPGTESLEIGAKVVLSDQMGRQFRATVTAKTAETITFDTNHELAGKELNFDIELVEVEE